MAKWSDDDIWYNATILDVQESEAQVRFDDYGNEATEVFARLVRDSSEIPASDAENIDECVTISSTTASSRSGLIKEEKVTEANNSTFQEEVHQLQVGDLVFAKWDEDKIWYNAKIQKIDEEIVEVVFVDYGNEDEVRQSDIVKLSSQIPSTDDYDENIVMSSSDSTKVFGTRPKILKAPDIRNRDKFEEVASDDRKLILPSDECYETFQEKKVNIL